MSDKATKVVQDDHYKTADEERLRELFYWMHERQEVFRRRFVEEQDSPWTDERILRQYRFCNVYRELDRGTQFALYNILNWKNNRDVLLNTVFYRLLNLPESYKASGGFTPVDQFDADKVVRRLDERDDRDERLFSSAYRSGHTMGSEYDKLHKAIVYETLQDHLVPKIDEYVEVLLEEDPQSAMEHLKAIPQVGDFVAYEIMTDLSYGFVPATEDDFLTIGPGATNGLKLIWDEADEKYVHWLAENESELFDTFGFDFYRWNGYRMKSLTLRAIEHSLCEYTKFHRAKTKKNPSLRKFEAAAGKQLEMDTFRGNLF